VIGDRVTFRGAFGRHEGGDGSLGYKHTTCRHRRWIFYGTQPSRADHMHAKCPWPCTAYWQFRDDCGWFTHYSYAI